MENKELEPMEQGRKGRGKKRAIENIEHMEERRFAGKHTFIAPKEGEPEKQVLSFWQSMEQDGDIEALRALAPDGLLTGLCAEFGSKGYVYWIGVQVDANADIPEGLETIYAPAGDYAVFECQGPAHAAVHAKWNEIYNKWFPRSGYNHPGTAEVELYPAGDMDGADYGCTINVPVEPAKPITAAQRRPGGVLGAMPFIMIGALVGILITSSKSADAKATLIGAVVGGAAGYFAFNYYNKRKEQKQAEKDERGEDDR